MKPCARCHAEPRYGGQSYCRACLRIVILAWRERLEVDERLGPAEPLLPPLPPGRIRCFGCRRPIPAAAATKGRCDWCSDRPRREPGAREILERERELERAALARAEEEIRSARAATERQRAARG